MVLGALSIIITLIVVLNPSFGTATIVSLLAFAVILNSFRIVSSGGAFLPAMLRGITVGLGILTAIIVAIVILSPSIGLATLTLVFAIGLAIQGLARLAHTAHVGHPRWLRVSALTTGAITIVLASIIATLPSVTKVSLVALLSLALVVNGIDSVVAGIRPRTRKQLTLVKLVLFALAYGFVNVNWIDLYYNRVPAYHLWLVLTYMAPFGVLLVFQGLKDWQLALSLGLLVSLVNDLGYYFSGDLFFGFHVQLIPWLEGQLGLEGGRLLFTFQGGPFTIPVTSYLMGASVYARVAVVALVIYHWWRRPTSLPG
ncbi:MAG TPA: DUF308 domain-containing protein [Nitrososphaerales archaeon]|nr:DUF308 domain-containing protein [Nitrososphaerales archaeon]